MVLRKPLVTINGVNSELPPGDSVEGAVLTTSLTAGSGLTGGGVLSSDQRIDVSLASNPSGLILTGNSLGLDGVAQRTANTALASGNAALSSAATAQASGNAALTSAATAQASGNAALVSAATAQASGNAALPRAGGTMTGPIIFAAGQQINTAVNLSGGVQGAIPYQSAANTTAFLTPGTAGQVLSTQGSNQNPTWITPGGGKILQVVQTVSTTSFSTSSSSFVNITGLSLSITPSNASSRILLITSFGSYAASGQTSFFTFARNGSSIHPSTAFSYQTVGSPNEVPVTLTYVDSPSTVSACTYTVQMRSPIGGTAYINTEWYQYNLTCTAILIALEIGP